MATVPRLFPDGTVAVLAPGPSLTGEDALACQAAADGVVAVSDAWSLAAWADVLYAADSDWWRYHDGVPGFPGLKLSIANPTRRTDHHPDGVGVLAFGGYDGLSLDPGRLMAGRRGGQNSGLQAVGLAYLLGARRIVLAGFDCGVADDGATHFFGEHPARLRKASPYAHMAHAFAALAPHLAAAGVEVVNASRRSALTCFTRATLAQAFEAAA